MSLDWCAYAGYGLENEQLMDTNENENRVTKASVVHKF